jgi:hypothetical protein
MNQLPQARRAETWGELGAAMKALPNDQWRDFVYHYVRQPPRKGALVAAYRAAGYGKGGTPASQAKAAWLLAHDQRAIAAIAEESRKILHVAYPEGANALINLVRDPDHAGHVPALRMLMDRVFPAETRHNVEVTHKVVDPDQESLEELRALRSLGTSREKLVELFGTNGLDRLEMREAADTARRAEAAKVIDGELVEEHEQPQVEPSERLVDNTGDYLPDSGDEQPRIVDAEPEPETRDDF